MTTITATKGTTVITAQAATLLPALLALAEAYDEHLNVVCPDNASYDWAMAQVTELGILVALNVAGYVVDVE